MNIKNDIYIIHIINKMVEYCYSLEVLLKESEKYKDIVSENIKPFIEKYDSIQLKPISNYRKNHDKNGWREHKSRRKFNVKDFEKFTKNKWEQKLPKNDFEKIKRIVISYLNKLNEKKFTIITKNFIDSLEDLMYFDTYQIIIDELLIKILSDKQYLYIYARLIKELIINKKWQKKIISVTKTENGIFWSVNKLESDDTLYGPFNNEYETYKDALKEFSFENEIMSRLKKMFIERDSFIQNIKDNQNDFDLLIYHKNRFNNFIEFLYNLAKVKFLKESFVLHMLVQFMEKYKKTKCDEELNIFCHLYTLYNKKEKRTITISKTNHNFFEKEIKSIIGQSKMSVKTKFQLESLFSNLDIKTESKPKVQEKSDNSEVKENITCLFEEFPSHQCWEGMEDLVKEIPEKNYEWIIDELFVRILESNNEQLNDWIMLINILFDKLPSTNQLYKDKVEELNKDKESIELDYPNYSIYLKKIEDGTMGGT